MRYLFILLTVAGLTGVGSGQAQAQNGAATLHHTVQWSGATDVADPRTGARRREPTFSGAFVPRGEQAQMLALRIEGAVAQVEIQNPVYEPFTAAEAKLLEARPLPAAPLTRLFTGTERKLPVTTLLVQPTRRNPGSGQAERLVAFDYAYTLEPAPAQRGGGPSARPHAAHSVLLSGDWFKLGVADNGIYKLDKPALRALGLDPNAVNPNRLQLYGNSMGILPQPNAAYRPDDLMENNILFVGNADNTFDDGEYFLFYSPGAHTWAASGGLFQHRNNIYTDTTYYFVTVGNTPGRRVPTVAPPTGTPAPAPISTFAERRFYEHDLVNLIHSGRQWLGEAFNVGSGAQKEFAFGGLTDLVPGSPVRLTASLAAGASAASTFGISLNGTPVASQSIGARSIYAYSAETNVELNTYQATLPASPAPDQRIGLNFANGGDPAAAGYLDYLEINLMRQLRLASGALEFRSFENIGPGNLSRFALTAPAGTVVWDVTNPRRALGQTLDGSGGFVARTDTLREYVALLPGPGYATPRAFGRVPNQDLHALDGTTDLVIVTYPPFRGQAERLANHRRSHDNLRVAVVTTTEVYNEYGSGGQDVTAIRDLMKQVYDRAPAGKEQFLLLFGDASFDYKSDPSNDKTQEPAWWSQRTPFRTDGDFDRANQNYVPTYESRESFAPFYTAVAGTSPTYSSEDYYSYLDDSEGEWSETSNGSEMLDIGVGRLPVRTPKGSPADANQARLMVDKLIAYDAPSAYGKWRNRITLAADDSDSNAYVSDSEPIADKIQQLHPEYNVHKTYLDMYPQLALAAGQRSPACNAAVDEAFERGSLLWNYVGHGGPKGLADEQIFTNAMALNFQNPRTMPFMVTGTCDLSTYDNPDYTSAGEQVLTDNPSNGGAIGLFTTTRVVNASENATLTQSFFKYVLQPVNGVMPRIGTVVLNAKSDLGNRVFNSRNYTILGDPSMRLAYPEQDVVLDRVNGRAVSGLSLADTLQALNRVQLHGQVRNGGVLNPAFNGTVQLTLYDKPTTVTTLGDETGTRVPIQIQESVVYGGQATVVGGEFTATFVIPKDINYSVGLGKLSLYAADGTRRVDGHGSQPLLVGGAGGRNALPRDTIPPLIALYLDNDTGPQAFANGGLTGQNPTLLAHLSDESGINTTGAGIGHEITAIIDHDRNKLLILNDAYVAELNNFKAGKVNNLYKDLAPGPHVITLKAWDTFNNSAEKDVEFVVAHTEQLALDHVLNYPNPFAGTTTFHFDHNRQGDDLDIQVQVFTVSGKLVKTLRTTVLGSEPHQKSISWNGRDDYDDQLARGVYVYRVSVRTQNGNSTAAKFEKLVLLN